MRIFSITLSTSCLALCLSVSVTAPSGGLSRPIAGPDSLGCRLTGKKVRDLSAGVGSRLFVDAQSLLLMGDSVVMLGTPAVEWARSVTGAWVGVARPVAVGAAGHIEGEFALLPNPVSQTPVIRVVGVVTSSGVVALFAEGRPRLAGGSGDTVVAVWTARLRGAGWSDVKRHPFPQGMFGRRDRIAAATGMAERELFAIPLDSDTSTAMLTIRQDGTDLAATYGSSIPRSAYVALVSPPSQASTLVLVAAGYGGERGSNSLYVRVPSRSPGRPDQWKSVAHLSRAHWVSAVSIDNQRRLFWTEEPERTDPLAWRGRSLVLDDTGAVRSMADVSARIQWGLLPASAQSRSVVGFVTRDSSGPAQLVVSVRSDTGEEAVNAMPPLDGPFAIAASERRIALMGTRMGKGPEDPQIRSVLITLSVQCPKSIGGS